MRYFFILAMSAFSILVAPSALASSHGGISQEIEEHLLSRWNFQFQHGMVQHGQHMAWRMVTEDIFSVAQEIGQTEPVVAAFAQEVMGQRACLASAPTAAYSNTSEPMHYGCVHPVHDQVANLHALLNTVAPQASSVLQLNKAVNAALLIYNTGAVCGYTGWREAHQQNNTSDQSTPDGVPMWFPFGQKIPIGAFLALLALLVAAAIASLPWERMRRATA